MYRQQLIPIKRYNFLCSCRSPFYYIVPKVLTKHQEWAASWAIPLNWWDQRSRGGVMRLCARVSRLGTMIEFFWNDIVLVPLWIPTKNGSATVVRAIRLLEQSGAEQHSYPEITGHYSQFVPRTVGARWP